MTFAVKFLSSLFLMVGKPPVGQPRAWSTEKGWPQTQLLGRLAGCQLYHSYARSSLSHESVIVYRAPWPSGTTCRNLKIWDPNKAWECINQSEATAVISNRVCTAGLASLSVGMQAACRPRRQISPFPYVEVKNTRGLNVPSSTSRICCLYVFCFSLSCFLVDWG